METTKVLFSSPMYPEVKCDPNSEWGVYYNTDTQSEDFETGDSLPGLKTTVIVENIDKQSADIIANALNIHSETGLTPSQLLEQRDELLKALEIIRDYQESKKDKDDAVLSVCNEFIQKTNPSVKQKS